MTLIEFIENAVKGRELSESVWRGGTGYSWRAAGCKLSKSERGNVADIDAKIAAKIRIEVEMFKAVLCFLKEKSK